VTFFSQISKPVTCGTNLGKITAKGSDVNSAAPPAISRGKYYGDSLFNHPTLSTGQNLFDIEDLEVSRLCNDRSPSATYEHFASPNLNTGSSPSKQDKLLRTFFRVVPQDEEAAAGDHLITVTTMYNDDQSVIKVSFTQQKWVYCGVAAHPGIKTKYGYDNSFIKCS
jgi:hypothetical protein